MSGTAPVFKPLPTSLFRAFSRPTAGRGLEYATQRRVDIRSVDARSVQARVNGSETYDVTIEVHRPALVRASCTCPVVASRAEPCKHIYAVLLVAQGQNGFTLPHKASTLRLSGDVTSVAGADPSSQASTPRASVRPSVRHERYVPVNQLRPKDITWERFMGAVQPHALRALEAPSSILADRCGYVVRMAVTRPLPTMVAGAGPGAFALDDEQLSLTIDIVEWRSAQSGPNPWGRAVSYEDAFRRASNDDERMIIAMLQGSESAKRIPERRPIDARHLRALLPLLARTERAGLIIDHKHAPITWDAGGDWSLVPTIAEGGTTTDGQAFGRLSWTLQRSGDATLSLDRAVRLLDFGVGAIGGRFFSHDVRIPLVHLEQLLRESASIPASQVGDAAQRLMELQLARRVIIDPALGWREVTIKPTPGIQIRPTHKPTYVTASVFAEYGATRVELKQTRDVIVDPVAQRLVLRDREAEGDLVGRALDIAAKLGGQLTNPPEILGFEGPNISLANVIRPYGEAAWTVMMERTRVRTASAWVPKVTSGLDWFAVDGDVAFEDTSATLPILLGAIRSNTGLITLADGSLGVLPESLRARLAMIDATAERMKDGSVHFATGQAMLLDAVLKDLDVQADATFDRVQKRIRSFDAIKPKAAPKSFRGELRHYQSEALSWFAFLRDFELGGCLADDMGLGKTVQVLALLEARRNSREAGRPRASLVVMPRSVMTNWQAEAARFAPKLDVHAHTGTERHEQMDELIEHDLVITTYATMLRDIDALAKIEFDYVILDEAQAIKNRSSLTARAARSLKGKHRLALSGTPVENHIGELWSLLDFLNPGFSGGLASDTRGPLDEERLAIIRRSVRPLILRRTKTQVAPELPERIEQSLTCEMPTKQRSFYDRLATEIRAELDETIAKKGLARSKIHVLEALLRLRQAACHPGLVDKTLLGQPCAKFDVLLPMLEELREEGHKTLVFSQFTQFLGLLRKELEERGDRYEYLDGSTRDRQAPVTRFQSDPTSKLFLISLKAGGLGLNLTAADNVILLDPWWNPAVEAQAIDRAHRIGQNRTVIAHRLIAENSIEQRVLTLQETKRGLADALIRGDDGLVSSLTRDDLEALLA